MRKSFERLGALYKRASETLSLAEPRVPGWLLVLAALAAYGVGFLVRQGVAERSIKRIVTGPDGDPMFVTLDAYYYATGVERTLHGLLSGFERVPLPGQNFLIDLSAFLLKHTGRSVPLLAGDLPLYIAPLMGCVIVFCGYAIKLPRVGIVAALPAAIGYSFLNRTSPGQLDTDIFSVALPYLTLSFAAYALSHHSRVAALFAGFLCLSSGYVHPGSERVLAVASVMVALYVVLAQRTRHGAVVAIVMFAGLAPVPIWLRAVLVCVTFGLELLPKIPGKVLALVAAVATVALIAQLASRNYFKLLGVRELADAIQFYDVRVEVTELQTPSKALLMQRVAGGPWLYYLGLIGTALMVFTQPLALLILPMVVLGTFGSMFSGLRFTIYAAPGLALGAAYLFCALTDLVRVAFPKGRTALLYVGGIASFAALFVPALSYGRTISKGSAVAISDARLLYDLQPLTNEHSYVLTWWDYGYPIWYYSHARCLVDGSKHDEDLFVISEIMYGDSQLRAAQLARLAVENQRAWGSGPAIGGTFAQSSAKGLPPDQLLETLGKPGFALPEKKGEIYLFLPLRTAPMAMTWVQGRRVKGVPSREHIDLGYMRSGAAPRGLRGNLALTSGDVLDTQAGMVMRQAGPTPVASVITVGRGRDGKVQLGGKAIHPNGKLHVLHLPDRGGVIVVDEIMLKSVFVQLALFERPDPRAFEPVFVRPEGAIYRVVP